jgi:hypothetical protein
MESEKVENILIKKLASCDIRCEFTFMQNTTSAETGTAQASRIAEGDIR